MESCYDCIHCGACSDAGDSGFSSLKEDVSRCKHFKNKEDVVSVEAFEQVKWERDTAIEQLESYGVGFCEEKELVEVVRCKDCKDYSGKYCRLTDDTEDRREPDDFCSYGERKDEK